MSGDNVHVTRAEVRQMLNSQREALNEILQGFQRDLIGTQSRIAAAWNGMNAVLKSFLEKGLITEADVIEAGRLLMQEAQRNMEMAKAVGPGEISPPYIKTPIETFQAGLAKKEDDETN